MNSSQARLNLVDLELWVSASLDTWLQANMEREFPPSLFEPLLLPKKPQMERLSRVKNYLAGRKQTVISGNPSIFEAINTKESFAVQ